MYYIIYITYANSSSKHVIYILNIVIAYLTILKQNSSNAILCIKEELDINRKI